MTMTREEAIKTLNELLRETNDPWYEEVYNMAIEALSAEPIYCNECKHQDYCHQTVSYTKVRLGYNEHGAMPVEWCSRAADMRGEKRVTD